MSRLSHLPAKPKGDYRSIERLSYSALSLFTRNRRSFYRQIILREGEKNEENESILRGQIVDILLTAPNDIDRYFFVSKVTQINPQMKSFCEHLFNTKIENPEWDMGDLTQKAYKLLCENNFDKDGKLKKVSTGYDKYVENFAKDGAVYFQELLENSHRQVVTIEDLTICHSIVEKAKSCKAFQMRGNRKLTKVQVLFDYGTWKMKCELDEIDIDDTNKVIYPLDDKVTNFVDTFTSSGFLGRKYYLQSGLYRFALDSAWKHQVGLSDYRVENMDFKVMDQADWYLPLLYKTTDEHYQQAFTGFYANGKYYPGIDSILEEIKQHTEMDNWSMSIENIRNGGEVFIPSFKQDKD